MEQFYTADQIRSIAFNSNIEVMGPSFNSTFKFKRFLTVDGKLFAKQSMSRLNQSDSYFLCNEFYDLADGMVV